MSFIFRKYLLISAAVFLLFVTRSAETVEAAAALEVGDIEVSVQSEGARYALSPLISKRMQASIYTIADNVLTGRPVNEILEKKDSYERLIQDVFDRILVGYSVKAVRLDAAVHTKVNVTVVPWQDIIQEVAIDIEVAGVQKEIETLVKGDVQDINRVVEQILVGLPMDAVEWTSGIMKASLNEFLMVHLPEFRVDFEIEAAEKTKVKLLFYPKGAVVREVNLSLRSSSIPNILLLNFRPGMQKQAENIVGAPVTFVERHQDYFMSVLMQKLNADKDLKNFAVETKLTMAVGEKTDLMVVADTDKYHISVEGYLDMGRREDSTSFRLHAGKYISPADELYLEIDFIPHEVKWNFLPGISHKLTPEATLGFKYDIEASNTILWARQHLSDRWQLRFEHTPSLEFNEFAMRYQLHDFVGVEYILNDDDQWLRLVGYF